MAISFNEVPGSSRIPFVYVEIDGSRAAPDAPEAYRVLLIGGALSTGSAARHDPTDAASGEVVPIYDAADAQRRFGRGSMLAAMAAAYRRQHPLGRLWGVGIDDSGGTEGTRTVTVTAASAQSGTIALYVAGRRVAVTVTAGQDAAAIAGAIEDAVTARTDLPVTASVTAAVVTLTMRAAGPAGWVDVRDSLHPDESLPSGVTLAYATGTAAATDPDLDDLWARLGDERYDLVVSPYTATAQIQSIETELAARWGVARQLGGVGIAAYRGAAGTAAQATTYGDARNSPYVVVMDAGKSLSPDYEWAAAVAGQVARSAEIDPARPFQTLPLARRRGGAGRGSARLHRAQRHAARRHLDARGGRGRHGAHRAADHHVPDRPGRHSGTPRIWICARRSRSTTSGETSGPTSRASTPGTSSPTTTRASVRGRR